MRHQAFSATEGVFGAPTGGAVTTLVAPMRKIADMASPRCRSARRQMLDGTAQRPCRLWRSGDGPAAFARASAARPAHRRMIANRAHPLRIVLLITTLAGCGRPDDATLAVRGATDTSTPVHAAVSLAIKAPVETVWSVLIDIADWPTWQPDIQATSITGPPRANTSFEWKTSGGTIRSQIKLFEPERRLAWVGHLLVFRAIHVWTLAVLPTGNTEVTTTESLGGWPITLFYSSDELQRSDQRWLDALRREAERRALLSKPNHS